MPIAYSLEPDLGAEEFRAVLIASTLGRRRPVGDLERLDKMLIAETRKSAGELSNLVLVAAPGAESYYPRIGMQQHHSCWRLPRAR